MRIREHKPTALHVNRVRAAGKIAPLLSRRRLLDLPWVFRIAFFLVGIGVLIIAALVLTAPLWL